MNLTNWIGRTESATDTVTEAPAAALSATLDRNAPPPRVGDPLPLLWHWLYFLPRARQSDLGEDGHARLGGFLPPVPLPRRMYAGGRIQVHHPIRVGEGIERTSHIVDVTEKDGKSGPLVFVQVHHEIRNRAGVALTEDHDIVYRENPPRHSAGGPRGGPSLATGALPAQPKDGPASPAPWEREVRADEVLLFRYSALTFNGYRIHYDRRFAIEVQGYPGLVVHAPLVATLLADLLGVHLPHAEVSDFRFKAITPLFDTSPFTLFGRPADDGHAVRLWATDSTGATAFEVNVGLRTT